MISYEGRTRGTVNMLKTIYFDRPEWTVCSVSLLPATWIKYREGLEEVVLSHPRIFPGYKKGSRDFDAVGDVLQELGRHTDCWGAVWDNVERGLSSLVVEHPLADWSAFEAYRPPDPMTDDTFGPRADWEQVRLLARLSPGERVRSGMQAHGFAVAGLRATFRRRFPGLPDAEINMKVLAHLTSIQLPEEAV